MSHTQKIGEENIFLLKKSGGDTPHHLILRHQKKRKIDEYAQKYDLLTDSVFDGKVEGFGAAVIVLA